MEDETDLGIIANPSTQRAQEIEERDAQQPLLDTLSDAFLGNTAAGAGLLVLEDEQELLEEAIVNPDVPVRPEEQPYLELAAGVGALLGFRAGDADYDKTAMYDELTQGIPYSFHDEIVGNDNLAAAKRARARVLEDMERGRRLGLQKGATSGLAMLAGSAVDVDLPLNFLTGGGYGAARVARAGIKVASMANLPKGAALRATSALTGINSGLQSGALSGAAEIAWRDTADWTTLADAALTGAAIGGAAGGVLKNDVGLQVRAAQDELAQRVARDDKSLTGRGLDVEAMPTKPMVIELEQSTVGAAATNGTERINRDALGAEPRIEDITRASEDWRKTSGWLERKREAENEWLENFVTRNTFGSRLAADYAALYRSESPTANFLAGAVFESPHGYGRGTATAAILNDHYTRRIVEPTLAAQDAQARWAKRNNQTLMNTGVGVSDRGNRAFSREVSLEINARRQGRAYSDDPDVRAAADAYRKAADEALNVARGREGQIALDGFEDITPADYLPYRWNGRKLRQMIRDGQITEEDTVSALANAYRSAGMSAAKDAEQVAKAVVTRMQSQADGVSVSLFDLRSGDGRAFLEEILTDSKLPEADRVAILERITGEKDEAGKSSHAKSRNEIDLEAPLGDNFQIIDLMDDDLHTSWHRYARSISGASALARQGITSRARREDIITAIRKEQQALGEREVDGDLIRAMMTHFDGGPVSGYAMGRTNKGIGVAPSLAKRLTNLALLGKLGITQLGETGASMAAQGLENWVNRGVMSRLNKLDRKANRELINDLAFVTGRIGEDHRHFAPHLELDDLTAHDAASFASTLQGWIGKAQWVQGYTSLFNQVRTWQQTTAALGISDKLVKAIRDEGDSINARIENDFGLDHHTRNQIRWLIEDGVIEMRNRNGVEYVHRLNMEQWDVELSETFGAAVSRSVNQQVQKSLAGEQDAWLHTEAASMLMHLKTFPMQAVTKQFARNMRYFDQENWAVLGMGMATAYMALSIRDAIDGRDRDAGERAKAAFGYSNMTGFIPMLTDPTMTALGMEHLRFNQYGPHSEVGVASLDVANNLMRVPGAVVDTVTGDANGYDRQALMALPFMNTAGLSRLF